MLQVYTGNGKGKTTASVGQMIRYSGYNKKAIFVQFLKTTTTGEVLFLEKCENIKVMRVEKYFPFSNKMSKEQLDEIREIHNQLFDEALELLEDSENNFVVFDEIISTYNLNLVDKKRVLNFLSSNKDNIIIITGRDCPKEILDIADYISEIDSIKNPFDIGEVAKKGIEY